MSATHHDPRRMEQPVSGWAVGALAFAATMMVMIGVFQAMMGLVAIVNDDFFLVARNYTFNLDVTAWGWIHLVLGLAVLGTGLALVLRKRWAAYVAIAIAGLSAIDNFFFIPHYPLWSLLLIALNVWVIWALTRAGVLEA